MQSSLACVWLSFSIIKFTNCVCYCPTPKLSPHRKLCIFTFSRKKTHSAGFISILKRDLGQCPHKSPSPCNTYVIPMLLYKCMSSFVTKTHTHKKKISTVKSGNFSNVYPLFSLKHTIISTNISLVVFQSHFHVSPVSPCMCNLLLFTIELPF